MRNFKLGSLWQKKDRQPVQKKKPTHSINDIKRPTKEDWDMSPQDALRVTYSGHK